MLDGKYSPTTMQPQSHGRACSFLETDAIGVLEVPRHYARRIPNLVLRLARDEPAHHFERTLGFQVAVQVPEQRGDQNKPETDPSLLDGHLFNVWAPLKSEGALEQSS